MLRYLKETEEAINTGVEQMKENDRFDLDAFNAFRVIISACRAIVLSHLGFKAQVRGAARKIDPNANQLAKLGISNLCQ